MGEKIDRVEILERMEFRLNDLKVLEARIYFDLGIDWTKYINRIHREIYKETQVNKEEFRPEVSD